ncbi:hypothetical protein ACWGID_19390 [Kribbella sp. NPDC054772]
MRERSWSQAVWFSLLRAVGLGLGVGAVVAIVLGVVGSMECEPDEDCLGVAAGFLPGILAGMLVTMVTVVVLSIRQRVPAFGIGVAIALPTLLGPGWLLLLDHAAVYALLSLIVFVGCTALSRHLRRPRTTD